MDSLSCSAAAAEDAPELAPRPAHRGSSPPAVGRGTRATNHAGAERRPSMRQYEEPPCAGGGPVQEPPEPPSPPRKNPQQSRRGEAPLPHQPSTERCLSVRPDVGDTETR
ncbi:unnamed protein product [Prorocentrum cordatum]|uniref:Uncharacterized protein n=1 Tax=Prorocentrum cordatum TaxID=2364126 RepID=A0ABN9U326_9DINO|nr:unnamed protein product [Polarella glacialis]